VSNWHAALPVASFAVILFFGCGRRLLGPALARARTACGALAAELPMQGDCGSSQLAGPRGRVGKANARADFAFDTQVQPVQTSDFGVSLRQQRRRNDHDPGRVADYHVTRGDRNISD
jgi:hypothetical protein